MTTKILFPTLILSLAITAPGCGGDDAPADPDGESEGTTGGMDETDGDPSSPSTTSPSTTSDPTTDGSTSGDPTTDGSTSGDPTDGSTSGDPTTDGSTGEPIDDVPPTILSVSPADGAVGVMPDAAIVVTFSEPMDKAATQAAYQSVDLPAGEVTMSWNDEGDVLTITPNEPLEVADGSDPETVEAVSYAFSFNTAASDSAGNDLEQAYDSGFSTIRSIATGLPPLGAWSGSIRADGTVSFVTLWVGDSGSVDNAQYKGFISFELSGLPDDIVEFQAAEMWLYHSTTFGSPYTDLGDLSAYDVEYTEMNLATFQAAPLAEAGLLSTADVTGWRVLEVDSWVVEDYEADRDATQFRLEFDLASDFDGLQDIASFEMPGDNPPRLWLYYLVP